MGCNVCGKISAAEPEQPFPKSIGGREILTNQRLIFRILPSLAVTRGLLGAGLCLLASPAFAEVSDKILSVPGMWVQAILIGCVAIFAGRFRWWLGLPFMVLPIVIALGAFGLRHASELGREIIKEQGESYFVNFYASALLAALMVGMGIWMGWRRRQQAT